MRKFTSKDLLAARTGAQRRAHEECHIAPFQAAIDFFRLNVGRGRLECNLYDDKVEVLRASSSAGQGFPTRPLRET
jgi:hypothetical protein